MAEEKKTVAAKAPKESGEGRQSRCSESGEAPKAGSPPRRKPKTESRRRREAPKAEAKAAAPKAEKKAAKAVSEDKYENRLIKKYKSKWCPTLIKKFGYTSIMQCPKLEKIVINIGVGDATQNAKALEDSVAELATITGQHPVTTKAKKVHRDLQGPPGTGHWLQSHASWLTDVRVLR
jgi:hypothetical protein